MRNYAGLFTQLLADLDLDLDSYSAYPTSDSGAVLCGKRSLAQSFLRKLAPNGTTAFADANALKKFKSINDSLSQGPFSFYAINEAESYFYDLFKDNLRVALEPRETGSCFDLAYIREHMDVGPGAAQKADSRCMYTKLFESSLSYTNPFLVTLYRGALSETGSWADAEMQRFQEYGLVRVAGGKIFFAKKNADISRTCCTEAGINMLIQKAVGAFLEERLGSDFGINLSTQPDLNRELACRGSIDGSIATIDLISASDCMELHMCKRDIPDGYLKGILMNARSETAVLPDGTSVELNMVSTMGNGFTFPLQTLIFACVVKAAYCALGLPALVNGSNFGVFGDDLCVRREAYHFVCQMLVKLGFGVNETKSFNDGPFRESCGEDYYQGLNIRGVYVQSLETPQQIYSLINRLHRWSARHGVCLPGTIRLLRSWARDIRVPPSESDDAGIHVPFELSQPRPVSNNYWFNYRCCIRQVRKMQLGEQETPLEAGGSVSNTNGLAVCFLSGRVSRRDVVLKLTDESAWSSDWALSVSLRDGIGVRSRYKVVSKSLPYWDYLGADPKIQPPFSPSGEVERRIGLTTDSYDSWKAVVMATYQNMVGEVD